MAYDTRPSVKIPGPAARCGWTSVREAVLGAGGEKTVVVETYPGSDAVEIRENLMPVMGAGALVVDALDLLRPEGELHALLQPFLTDDRVFGRMSGLAMEDILDAGAVEEAREAVRAARAAGRPVLVVGPGAALVADGGLLVYADMPRWEIQLRMRAGAPNWTAANPGEDILLKYKRGYFIEWRVADRWKMRLFDRVDCFLDTTAPGLPKLVEGRRMRAALVHATTRPFRVVPYFDPGVWGGDWMRERFGLPADKPNYAWGFDCVPEENSLLLEFGGVAVEVPAINLVLRHPEALLGERVHRRFGAEFPIRFDFLDTVNGGNLSLQVHPTEGYARDKFAIPYTQDESYYILEAAPDAHVYLGLKDGIEPADLFAAVEAAQAGGPLPDVARYVNRWPARKHDHFSIPAGTVHCAGAGCVVLEISATPYIFTFKLWDWGRLGLDGRPRPVHTAHGRAVLDPSRDARWVEREILDLTEPLSEAPGIREERTGLHPLEFIETRRHWFSEPVAHETDGSVHVLNLVEGDAAVVDSPTGAFAPFEVGYAETFIVPAAVGTYVVRPRGTAPAYATLRASVRP